MMNLFRETAAGQIIRFISRDKLLQYPEELLGFTFQYPSHAALDGTLASYEKTPSDTALSENAHADAGISSGDGMSTEDKSVLVDWYTAGSCPKFKQPTRYILMNTG